MPTATAAPGTYTAIRADLAANPDGIGVLRLRGTDAARRAMVCIVRDGRVRDVTGAVAAVAGLRTLDRDGDAVITVPGHGFAIADHIADALSLALYGELNRVRYYYL